MLTTTFFLAIQLAAGDSTPAARIAALPERVWLETTADDGQTRLRFGLPVERLTDLSEAGYNGQVAFWRRVDAALKAIPDAGLSDDDLVTKESIAWLAARGIESAPFYWFTSNVTPYASPMNGVHSLFGSLPVASADDRARYLRLAEQYAGLVRTIRTKLEGQVARKLVVAAPDVDASIPLWKAYQKPVREHALWVNTQRLATVGEADRRAFEARLEKVLGEQALPAIGSVVAYLEGPYRAAAPTAVGLSQYPGGKDYYRYLVRYHTTTSISPEDLFAIGNRQIDSLERELESVRRQVGFKGTAAQFKESLRTDPRFFVKTPEEVAARLEGYARSMETKLDSLFGRRPKAPYGVARLAPELEPAMTYGYYEPPKPGREKGLYFFNGSKLNERNLAMAEGLTYHELAPGHHFQFSLQRENTGLPKLRQTMYYTAHGEGWGDYSSMLGADAGLYRDPYSRAGRLMMEMMLGTRLVLDVGMNHLGWSLERARKFMAEHTLETETQIKSETLRYSVDIPGQALAYRMGSLTIRRIREDARRKLGPRWDVRGFHDRVLLAGPMPLEVLERHVGRWVAARQGGR